MCGAATVREHRSMPPLDPQGGTSSPTDAGTAVAARDADGHRVVPHDDGPKKHRNWWIWISAGLVKNDLQGISGSCKRALAGA
jgi:hypothetical protein